MAVLEETKTCCILAVLLRFLQFVRLKGKFECCHCINDSKPDYHNREHYDNWSKYLDLYIWVSFQAILLKDPEFDWNSELQGYVLSSFYYGYIATQILGGYLSAKFGGKIVFGISIGTTSVLTLLTPLCASINVYLLLAVRILEGVSEGVIYPCMQSILSKWAPPAERNRMATIAFSGSNIGTVVSMPLSALLADVFGWRWIFYFFGIWWKFVLNSEWFLYDIVY